MKKQSLRLVMFLLFISIVTAAHANYGPGVHYFANGWKEFLDLFRW